MKTMTLSGLEQVAAIGVDSGLIMIADPCYHVHADEFPTCLGRSWGEFIDTVHDNEKDEVTRLWFNKGHDGLGAVIRPTGGDGTYPVYVERNSEGEVRRVIIDFD
jgi:hypothetical protein